jgi:hypothetical protein
MKICPAAPELFNRETDELVELIKPSVAMRIYG